MTPSEDTSLHKPPACEHQEIDIKTDEENREYDQWPNGGVRSEEGEAPASSQASDSANGTVGLEGEGACVGKLENCAAVSAASCGEQQQEEVDSELSVIREAPRTPRSDTESKSKAHNKVQSGNTQEGTMGQTQGFLPEKEEKNKEIGDLPEEREGEQETSLPSRDTRQSYGQKHEVRHSRFYVNLDVNASENGKEIQETGNGSERIHKSTGSTTPALQDIGEDLDSLSFRPNMAPGPVHNTRLEPAPDVKKLLDAAAGDQMNATQEMASDCSEQVRSGSVKDPLPSGDVTVAPGQSDKLELDVSLTHEESDVETSVDQKLLPETEESLSAGSVNEIQSVISPEISEETFQILTQSQYGGEKPFQEHCDLQSDARDALIMDAMDQDPEQSLLLFWDQISTGPSGSLVSGSNPEETGSVLKLKLEKEPLAFQTPPESPCEFFSVDGFISTSGSIEATCLASLELGSTTGSQETIEEDVKVETELPEMCESSKKSPVTILCGSFSKLTIRGSPRDSQVESTTSVINEKIATSAHADDTETSTTLSSETEETKEEVIKLEPVKVETLERSETSQTVSNMSAAPSCDSALKENLQGTAAITYTVGLETQSDQPPESKDVQEECMKMPTQLGEILSPEILSLPCETLSVSTSVSQNITDPHSEDITFEEDTNKTSENIQTEITTLTETCVETSFGPNLVVSNFEENILEQPEIGTFVESISEMSPDLITSSEETVVETSLDPLPEVKISEESVQDQQLNVMISQESIIGTSLSSNLDFTSSVEVTGEGSLSPLLEATSSKESIQVQQLEKSTNDSHDPEHKVTAFGERVNESLEPHHDPLTTSEETIRETSCDTLPEVNSSEEIVLHQHLEVMTPEENVRETSLEPNHDLTVSSKETTGPCPEENVLDLQPQVATCEKNDNGTSQDPKGHDKPLEVTVSESGIQRPHHEVTIAEMAFDQQPEITDFEQSIRETPDHTQLEETTCEEDLRTSLEPSPEVLSSKKDECFPESPVQHEHAVLDPLVSCSDSGLASENVSSSGSLKISDQPVDLDSGTGLETDGGSTVEVDSGLIRDLPPLDSVGVNKSVTLEEEKSHTEEECGEEPMEEQVAGEKILCISSCKKVEILFYCFVLLSHWCLQTDVIHQPTFGRLRSVTFPVGSFTFSSTALCLRIALFGVIGVEL